ncbi:MAG: TetR/AcrR family transcriptional regulator [Actinomycetaceae bacterium]
MPRATAEEAARTAHRVLGAATEAFARDGFQAVSLDDVARAAGVTRGAVYHHFRNKEGLFRSVANEAQYQVDAVVVARAEEAGDDPGGQLRAGSHGFLDGITSAPVTRILLVDAPAVLSWSTWREIDARSAVVHLREAIAAVGVAPERVEPMTALLSGAMNEAALWVAEQDDRAAALEAAHAALDALLDGVVG